MFGTTGTKSGVEPTHDVEDAVRRRYSEGARAPERALCCPTPYDPRLLAVIPQEVVERDYGCGDPTRHLRPGETVLDLGSGSGKACFLASQVVGPSGRVIGIDMNDEMLVLARRWAPVVASRIGYANVEFRKGRIQDLMLDREWLDRELAARPIRSEADLARLEACLADRRRSSPLVSEGSIDVVVSNCVLNLVRAEDKRQLFGEIFRVLGRGGRAVISDIVCDEDVPEHMSRDPELWSGCISGALREDLFLRAFGEAGFYGITLLERRQEPWRTVEGIEFRSVTVAAWKGKEGACLDQKHAVIYRGPFRRVEDDDGHVLDRGVRIAVCRKTFDILAREPYRDHVDLVEPRDLIPLEQAAPFPCSSKPIVRGPRETKGLEYRATTESAGQCCSTEGEATSCCAPAPGADRTAVAPSHAPHATPIHSNGGYRKAGSGASFEEVLARNGLERPKRGRVSTAQVNVGRLCNQACRHCHVEAGPGRTEILARETAERIVALLEASPGVQVVDLTGGAPELNPSFPFLVGEVRRLGRRVIDRCNLTVLLEPGLEGMASFLADSGVEVIASLPCYGAENVDAQRGPGVFEKSIEVLRRLNALGYGRPGSPLRLDLVHNPGGPFLPPAQAGLEEAYKKELGRGHGIEFHRLLTITNMPLRRFRSSLEREGILEAYSSLLVEHFNVATAATLMCRSLVSVGWDGRLYDCDFNQTRGIALGAAGERIAGTIWALRSLDDIEGGTVATASHCFGCTAGAGSGCQGALQ